MGKLKGSGGFAAASAVVGALLVLFLLAPILGSTFSSAGSIPAVLMDKRSVDAIYTSFYCAFLATLLTLITGIPLAYILARIEFPGKGLLDALFDLPVLIPHNAAGIALLMLLAPTAPLGAAFGAVGIRFVDAVPGIVAAMIFVSAPFMIRSGEDAFRAVDPKLEHVARSLGATPFKAFMDVTLPLASRGIATGCLLTWARAVSEFGAVVILAYYPKTAPVQLFDAFVGGGLYAAQPFNALLMLLALLVLVAFRILSPRYALREV